MADDAKPSPADKMASSNGPVPEARPAVPSTSDTATAVNNKTADEGGNDRAGDKRKRGDWGGRGDDKGAKKRKKNGGYGSKKGDGKHIRDQIQERRMNKRKKIIEEDRGGQSFMTVAFTPEEIAAEERRPKRKAAVLLGYAGTGYHGLQINHGEKTIEGELFSAFVKAGMISKANADDPKKSSLMRCARTDKGVHAAGNVLSLKLIIEEPDVVEKLNGLLPEQIRVWGIHRTTNGFSSYQACESRWYEYLMPSYALLPPHPRSYLGKKIVESAEEKGVAEEYAKRLEDVKGFWEEVEKNDVQPILDRLDPEVRAEVVQQLQVLQDTDGSGEETTVPDPAPVKNEDAAEGGPKDEPKDVVKTEETDASGQEASTESKPAESPDQMEQPKKEERPLTPAQVAIRDIKAARIAAKRRYRVSPARLEKLQEALNCYLGTHNYHNYTILKSAKDPSAKRHIKSFEVNTTPIPIRDTEWLSLKVHGQSFMMHQIRKMVAMAVMLVRCGASLSVIEKSYEPRRISIPKAPSLGLMLERPMFDGYNRKASELERDPIDFAKYEDKIQDFKNKQIYNRMFETEEKENAFHQFFHQLDSYKVSYFLWVTAGGIESSHERAERLAEEKAKIPLGLREELGDDPDGVVEDDN